MPVSFGIDLSHWNGSVTRLRGLDFVIAKATEGASSKPDIEFENTRQKAHEAGVVFGAYHMLRETSRFESQIERFLEVVQPRPGEFLALDLETKWAKAMRKLHGATLLEHLVKCAEDLTLNTKARPLLYASRRSVEAALGVDFDNLRESGWAISHLRNVYDLWLVQYIDELRANMDPGLVDTQSPRKDGWWQPGKVVLRQYTSSGDGRALGVPDATVDFNLGYDLEYLKAVNCLPAKDQAAKIEPVDPGPWWSEAQILRAGRRVGYQVASTAIVAALRTNEPTKETK
jgi:GH25 family lysozyme M1 (1,4-beta-N-acetylmuramidase)